VPKGHPGPFTSGVDNRRPDFKLKKHDNARGSDFLRSALNADIMAYYGLQ
jgi:hypothetical protein